MYPDNILKKAHETVQKLADKKLTIATAESCTGGLIIGALTEVSGSSTVVDRGFITYTNQSKVGMLGVLDETLEAHGAVSEQTVREMALGAHNKSGSPITVAVSGIAGPTGGSDEKPIGLVYFGFYFEGKLKVLRHVFKGNRQQVRLQTIETSLDEILSYLQK
ncbi:MAG: CinA family protein [Pseudomonadota bacterium]|nr:CinA family protein [Pseudomonadota bacterium]